MLIFNTTFHTDDDIRKEYVNFMTEVYIPQVIKAGLLSNPCFSKIHHTHEQQEGTSYSLQFRVENHDLLNEWIHGKGELLNKRLINKFGNKVAGFVTIMEEITIQQP